MRAAAGEHICTAPSTDDGKFGSSALFMNSQLTDAAVPWPCSQLGCGGSPTSVDAPEHVIGQRADIRACDRLFDHWSHLAAHGKYTSVPEWYTAERVAHLMQCRARDLRSTRTPNAGRRCTHAAARHLDLHTSARGLVYRATVTLARERGTEGLRRRVDMVLVRLVVHFDYLGALPLETSTPP
jgi:hypothetical protein